MNQNLTDISVVLDRSGSMATVQTDTIGGFNTFLAEQQKAEGEATFTLAQFDNQYQLDYDGVDIKNVKPLDTSTFCPRGSTALLDAIGMTILNTGARLAAMKEEDRPAKVIFVILTDGGENASREYKKEQINGMIKHQTETFNWDFVFLGANQDAIQVGNGLGVFGGNSMTYASNSQGTARAFESVASNMVLYRSGDMSKKSAYFTAEDLMAQTNAGVK